MLATLLSRTPQGLEAPLVRVEVDVGNGLPAFSIVGLLETAVKESKDRVRAALANCGHDIPDGRVTVNLAPADLPKDFSVIQVPDSLQALQRIAAEYRRTLGVQIVCITGSNGKTSTKDLTASVLRERFQVTKTEGNFNNHIGLPLTLLRLRAADRIGVIEVGMNHPGEIAPLAALAPAPATPLRSRIVTSCPASASHQAVVRPTTPAPRTQVFMTFVRLSCCSRGHQPSAHIAVRRDWT